MEWQDVVAKHLEKVEDVFENALISINKELRRNNLSLPFDDSFKQHLLCQNQNRFCAAYTSFVANMQYHGNAQEVTACGSGISNNDGESSNGQACTSPMNSDCDELNHTKNAPKINKNLLKQVVDAFLKRIKLASTQNNQPAPFNDAIEVHLVHLVTSQVEKNYKNFVSTEQYISETSISTVDSGCPSANSSQSQIESSISKETISSQTDSELVEQNASNASMMIAVLNSNEESKLAGDFCLNLERDGILVNIDLAGTSATNETEDRAQQNPKGKVSQSMEKQTNKRKLERGAKNSNKKPKVADISKNVVQCKCKPCQAKLIGHHYNTNSSSETNTLECIICSRKFETEQEWYEHMKKHMPEE